MALVFRLLLVSLIPLIILYISANKYEAFCIQNGLRGTRGLMIYRLIMGCLLAVMDSDVVKQISPLDLVKEDETRMIRG